MEFIRAVGPCRWTLDQYDPYKIPQIERASAEISGVVYDLQQNTFTVARILNTELCSVSHYFTFLDASGSRTFMRWVRILEPRTTFRVASNTVEFDVFTLVPYWLGNDPPPTEYLSAVIRITFSEATAKRYRRL